DLSARFPRMLSETGLFESVSTLAPAAGVEPYSITAEPWQDGAMFTRWVAVPGDAQITIDEKGTHYPDGTVFVKHLDLPRSLGDSPIRLETQLLHFENGSWRPYRYRWDESATDAQLADPAGENREVQVSDDPDSRRTWHIGSVNECRLCHNVGSDFVLGFNASQIEDLQRLTSVSATTTNSANKLVNPHDESASLEERARSYLHINCGICHNRQGPATISFFAHRDYPFDQLRITKRPAVGSFGIKDARLIAAGDEYSSVILYRMSKLGYGRMPYIGSHTVDSQGVSLLANWFAQLNGSSANENSGERETIGKLLKAVTSNRESAHTAEIDQLLQSTEGSLALSTALHRELIGDADRNRILAESTKLHGDLRGLFETFVPESKRRKTLGPTPDPQSILDLAGDADRGRLIFHSDGARCRDCHHASNKNESIGPTLSDIRGKLRSRNDVLTHVLAPSARVDEAYVTWSVMLTDGRVLTGLMLAQDNQQIQIRTAEKKDLTIHRAEIDELQKTQQSIMPNGTLSDLTPQQAADLISFILNADGN
ncbi:MAG: c-type cytochrome, partial [Planctomycetales bacterium]|nr:c-type cytochrome [Planctomycetales bacterium]